MNTTTSPSKVGIALALLATGAAANALAAGPAPGSVTANTLKLPSGPGSVRGLPSDPAFDPFSAQVQYEIPIEAPPFGVTSQVALSYAGTTGNGPVGIGWSLDTIAIRRSTRLGVPSYTSTDTLELVGLPDGGGRLFAIGGGEYRVEGRGDDVRVVASGAAWQVWQPDGTMYVLGSTAASRQSDGTRVAAWFVDSATDLAGRTVRYQYQASSGQLYLANIVWGPSDAYRMSFVYEPRPDLVVDYRTGFRVETAQRVASIEVRSFGEVLRRYQLSYDETFAVSRLSRVVQQGRGGQLALPELRFTYAAPAAADVQKVAGIGAWRLNVQGTSLLDVDGDGASDLMQLDAPVVSYRRNRRGLFGAPVATSGLGTVSLATSQFLDIDGDARAELVYVVDDVWHSFQLSGTTWSARGPIAGTAGLPLKDGSRLRFADINGDNFVDIITWNNDGLLIRYGQRGSFGDPQQVDRIGGTVLPDHRGQFHDTNGDGIADYVELREDYLLVYLGTGNGAFEPPQTVWYPWLGDYVVAPSDILLGDLNRDGVMDLTTAVLGQVTWFAGRPGFTFLAPVALSAPGVVGPEVVVALADTNGNGSDDVVWSSPLGMWRLDLAGPTNAGMLTRVDNGLGKVVTFSYDSSHSLAVKDETTIPWSEHLPISIPVVIREVTTLGPGETDRIVDYRVRDGFWDREEREFGGFLVAITRTWGATPAETSEIRTVYHRGLGDKRALRGKPLNIQIRDGAGALISVEEQTWDTVALPGYPAIVELEVPVMRSSATLDLEGGNSITTRTDYVHDAWGRIVRTTAHGRLDLSGDESVKIVRYADNLALWVRGKVCEEELRELDGTLVSHVRHYYGDAGAEPAPLCQASKGWLRMSESWLAEEHRWVMQDWTRYDTFGNPIETIANGVTRRFDYDAHRLYPVAERVQLASSELVWTMEWDYVLGAPIASRDPNGHRTWITYDALGRVTSTGLDQAPAHLIYQYDWTAPFPKTITYRYDGPPSGLTPFLAWSEGGAWREEVSVSNGRGEPRYQAVRVGSSRWIVQSYLERNANSLVTFVGNPVEVSTLALSARPAGMVGQSLRYDPLGRLIEQSLPNGTRRVYTHSPFEYTMTVDGLAPVRNLLDGQGRVRATERLGATGQVERLDVTYDVAGRITSLALQGGAVTHVFDYDSLGRLISAHDPDIGARELRYDDANRLVAAINGAGQEVTYAYDAAGRLLEEVADDGAAFRYHYDQPRAGEPAANHVSRLAWVEEPTGHVVLGYDAFGHEVRVARTIDGQYGEQLSRVAPSGLVLGYSYDDGFTVDIEYDVAGRAKRVGDLWAVETQDPAGRILAERFGNGVTQHYTRDALGLASRVKVVRGDGTVLYDVGITRTSWLAPATLTDYDGRGLDHSASFAYDPQGRLTSATLGASTFTYAYDALQNMTSRQVTATTPINVVAGTYRYGENGGGPRQLTSILAPNGTVHHYQYDAAGRVVADGGLTLTYDGLDQLVRVDGLAPGNRHVEYAYGYDGERIKTVDPDGTVSYWFDDTLMQRGDEREHTIRVGDRVIARVTHTAPPTPATPISAKLDGRRAIGVGLAFALGMLGVFALLAPQRRRQRGIVAAFLLVAIALGSCRSSSGPDALARVWTLSERTYFHEAFAAGATLFTGDDGQIVSERRFEPFGAPIDAYRETSNGPVVGAVDFTALDANSMAKRTDPATGWSYHGARWLAPSTARWLTPDPPVKAPDPKFLTRPWSLHPYQYVDQNPTVFWDPDGNSPFSVLGKYIAKRGIKKKVKDYVESRIRAKVMRLGDKKFQKEILDEAADIINSFDDPWYVTAIEFVPYAGDVYGAQRLLKKRKAALERLDKLERKVNNKVNSARYEVTPSGVVIPKNPTELKSNLGKLTDKSTNPASSRKFVGTDSQGPVRVRVEKAHPDNPNFTGTPDPLHTVDHMHIDRRANGQTGSWKSDEKVPLDWPF